MTLAVRNHSQIRFGSEVNLTCSVELSALIIGASDFSLLEVESQLYKDGVLLATNGRADTVMHDGMVTYIYTLTPFERRDSGNYTCTSIINSALPHLNRSQRQISNNVTVTTG